MNAENLHHHIINKIFLVPLWSTVSHCLTSIDSVRIEGNAVSFYSVFSVPKNPIQSTYLVASLSVPASRFSWPSSPIESPCTYMIHFLHPEIQGQGWSQHDHLFLILMTNYKFRRVEQFEQVQFLLVTLRFIRGISSSCNLYRFNFKVLTNMTVLKIYFVPAVVWCVNSVFLDITSVWIYLLLSLLILLLCK